MNQPALERKLAAGLQRLNLKLDQTGLEKLLRHLQLLSQWGGVYNLTGVKTIEEMLVLHVFDSLSIAVDIDGSTIVDVGTGAGFPGIPLAVIYPEKSFILLDSRDKKIRFINHIIQDLELSNVTTIKCRAETYHPPICFDTVVCRAFGNLAEIVQKMLHLCCNTGYILAMKGQYPQRELEVIKHLANNITVKKLSVPYLQAERHLIKIMAITASEADTKNHEENK